MNTLNHAYIGILIQAAFATPDKSSQKRRIMKLWEVGIIPADLVEHLIQAHGLKGE